MLHNVLVQKHPKLADSSCYARPVRVGPRPVASGAVCVSFLTEPRLRSSSSRSRCHRESRLQPPGGTRHHWVQHGEPALGTAQRAGTTGYSTGGRTQHIGPAPLGTAHRAGTTGYRLQRTVTTGYSMEGRHHWVQHRGRHHWVQHRGPVLLGTAQRAGTTGYSTEKAPLDTAQRAGTTGYSTETATTRYSTEKGTTGYSTEGRHHWVQHREPAPLGTVQGAGTTGYSTGGRH